MAYKRINLSSTRWGWWSLPVCTVLAGLIALNLFLPRASSATPGGNPRLVQGGQNLMVQAANPTGLPGRIAGNRFVDESGAPVFLMGVNYEGHTDRAWQMWEDGKFDPALIETDLAKAAEAGLNVVRIFVQKPLRDNINAGNWSKLDRVIELARGRGLRLLLTFNDYDEPDLSREAELNKKIAARYNGNQTLLGYDLKNEPQFGDVVPADYPAGTVVPLQDEGFIKTYGERISNEEVKQWRTTSQGKAVVPARLDERRAYLYANAYKLWLEFLNESGAWVLARSGKTTLDYLDSPDSDKWRGFVEALSGTLGKYIEVRQQAIRAVNPSALTTIGWSNIVFSKLGSNQSLSFVSLHRFVAPGMGGLSQTIALLENLKTSFPTRPVVLEEFGYSNARYNGEAVAAQLTANYETALWLYLYGKGFGGGFKWMLTNFPAGFNQVQNNFGLLDNDTRPKPAYHALRGVTGLVANQGHQPRLQEQSMTAAGTDLEYRVGGPNAFFSNARAATRGPVSYTQASSAPFAAWWNGSGTAQLYFAASQEAQVSLDLDNVYPQRSRQQPLKLFADDRPVQEQVAGSSFSFTAQPGPIYRLVVPVRPEAFNAAAPLSGALFFKETAHNLGGRFRAYWEKYGGLAINGLPVSEEFNENGLVVQYFERARFEYHPEFTGTRYEVLLGHLGRLMTAGREQEPPFQRIGPFAGSPARTYFAETGHSLAFGFKNYWEKNGALAQFGFPITEEFQERNPTDGKTYTVQYFERARFEYHPEFAGTRYEVLLGHLGWQLVRANGWMP